jgi:hydrogenase maturation protein HypF
MAFIYLLGALGNEKAIAEAKKLLPHLPGAEMDLIRQMMSKQTAIPTSSCGRLFDAVAALLGISPINNYEGQAAIELEACAEQHATGIYDYLVEKQQGMLVMNSLPIIAGIIRDIHSGLSVSTISGKFHLTLSDMFLDALLQAREQSGLNRVVLSGGVFHNGIILFNLSNSLVSHGFEVYYHQKVPPGDGGISLGQAVIANERVI